MLDERWVFHENAKAEPAGEGVVRRVLAYSKDLMCVENTFETGAEGKLHHHPHTQITYVVSGVFEFNIDGEIKTVKAGDTMLKLNGVEHGCVCKERGILLSSCFSAAAYTAGKSCYAFFSTGRFFCNYSIIPSVIFCFSNSLTICKSLPAISTIFISCITGFTTGGCLFAPNFSMEMFGCFIYAFRFCFTTKTTSKSFYTFFCTCRFFSDYSVIPAMIFCF